MNNYLTLYIEEHTKENELFKHGILFNNSLIIKMLIDGEEVEKFENFEDAFIVLDELKMSAKGSGKYLIFTCACGIAEDGGWEGVDVSIDQGKIAWKFEVADKQYRYIFDKSEYLTEIDSILGLINSSELKIEPKSVIFPENFRRIE